MDALVMARCRRRHHLDMPIILGVEPLKWQARYSLFFLSPYSPHRRTGAQAHRRAGAPMRRSERLAAAAAADDAAGAPGAAAAGANSEGQQRSAAVREAGDAGKSEALLEYQGA